MDMQCFARWNEDEQSGLCFRDQTMLQFGDSWDLLASLQFSRVRRMLAG